MTPKDQAKLQDAVRLIRGGDVDKALPLFRDLAQRHDGDAVAQYNYGNALRMAGRLGEAARQYRAALRLDPAHLDATLNLALACCELGHLDQALDLARTVLTRHPANPIAAMVLNLAVDMGGLDDAARDVLARMVATLDAAPAAAPADQGRLTYVRGIAHELLGHKTEAATILRQAAAFPDVADYAARRLLEIQDDLCQWADRESLAARVLALPTGPGTPLAPFPFLRFDRPEQALAIATAKAPRPQVPFCRGPARPRRGQRLRVGYLSPDFRAHATATLMAEVVELHDRARFDIQLFSCGPDDKSDMRARLATAADGFVDVHGLPGRDIAHKIHAAHVDILVDLSAFILLGRLDVLSWRPAPIQVAWLGYPGTTGAPYVDYIIADPVTIPDGSQHFYSEAPARLPVTYQPNDRQRAHADSKSRAEYSLPATGRFWPPSIRPGRSIRPCSTSGAT